MPSYNDSKERRTSFPMFAREVEHGNRDDGDLATDYDIGVNPKPGIIVTQDEYTQTIEDLYKKAKSNNLKLVPATLDDYIDQTKPDKNGKATESPTIKVYKQVNGKDKIIAEMSKDHCVLHQPLDTFVLKEIQQCYKSVEVSKCGSLEAALDIEEKMKGITFSESALKMIEDRFVKKHDITADRTQLDEFLSRARNQEDKTEFKFKPKTPGSM